MLPESTFRTVHDAISGRTCLGIGRLVNVLLVVVAGYTVLSADGPPFMTAGHALRPARMTPPARMRAAVAAGC